MVSANQPVLAVSENRQVTFTCQEYRYPSPRKVFSMVKLDDNMSLWNELCVTDPKYTKPFRRGGGFSGTDINPAWRSMRMTEVFGPIGIGWGYTVDREWSEVIGDKSFAFCKVSIWYLYRGPGEDVAKQLNVPAGTFIGGTEFGRAPDEAYKMAITDALGKCLMHLGLAADVYLGQFDDSKYQRQAAELYSRRAEGKLAATAEPADTRQPWDDNVMESVKTRLYACDTIRKVNMLAQEIAAENPPPVTLQIVADLFGKHRAIINGNGSK